MHKIAIVDDIKDSREFLSYLLSQDYDVTSYESGSDALQHFGDKRPDLVIMDIWLYGMDGVEVLKQIRQNEDLCRLPVIALTADAMSGDREKYLAAGFDDYISKPIIDIDIFLATVRRFLNGA